MKVVTGAKKAAWLILDVKYSGCNEAPAIREVVP
jgi:hypothetical protein